MKPFVGTFKSHVENRPSPIQIMTATEAIEAEQKAMQDAGTSANGGGIKTLLINSSIYSGKSSFRTNAPFTQEWKGMGPRGIVDPLLDRELLIRSQKLAPLYTGRHEWNTAMMQSGNYSELWAIEINELNKTKARAQKDFIKALPNNRSVRKNIQEIKKKPDKISRATIKVELPHEILAMNAIQTVKGQPAPIIASQTTHEVNSSNVIKLETMPASHNDSLVLAYRGYNPLVHLEAGLRRA